MAEEQKKQKKKSHVLFKLFVVIVLAAIVIHLAVCLVGIESLKGADVIGMVIRYVESAGWK
jgi:hypothetical protein